MQTPKWFKEEVADQHYLTACHISPFLIFCMLMVISPSLRSSDQKLSETSTAPPEGKQHGNAPTTQCK